MTQAASSRPRASDRATVERTVRDLILGVVEQRVRAGTSIVLEMYVDDVDKSLTHAVQLGGTPMLPPTDMFFGDRYCWVGDPWGHVWALATVKETLGEGEVQRRAEEFMLAISRHK